jgi:hypothetical protein
MADSSVIQMTTGNKIVVPIGIDDLSDLLLSPQAAPFMKFQDTNGRVHLINVNEIAKVRGQ